MFILIYLFYLEENISWKPLTLLPFIIQMLEVSHMFILKLIICELGWDSITDIDQIQSFPGTGIRKKR